MSPAPFTVLGPSDHGYILLPHIIIAECLFSWLLRCAYDEAEEGDSVHCTSQGTGGAWHSWAVYLLLNFSVWGSLQSQAPEVFRPFHSITKTHGSC